MTIPSKIYPEAVASFALREVVVFGGTFGVQLHLRISSAVTS